MVDGHRSRCAPVIAGLAPALAALLVACGSSAPPAEQPSPTPSPARRTPTPTVDAATLPLPKAGTGGPRDARAVGFRARDGVGLRGRLFGKGDGPVVVMAHMGQHTSNEADWFGLARALARKGYRVLAYNRRGVCSGDGDKRFDCSGGNDQHWEDSWQDVAGAVDYVGADHYAVIGSSIGASASLYAATSKAIAPDALVLLAGVNYMAAYSFGEADVHALKGAKLFVSGREDTEAARTAREFYGWAQEPKRLKLIDSYRHGTDMLAPAQPTHDEVTRVIVSFLTDALPQR